MTLDSEILSHSAVPFHVSALNTHETVIAGICYEGVLATVAG